MTEGGSCQDTVRKRPGKGHSHSKDSRGRDSSQHRKKATEQGALTNWRPQREELVRTWKPSNQAMGTHLLETTEGRTCQDTEREQLSEGHSLPGDRRGRDLSGDGKKVTEQEALTFWRPQWEGLVRTQKKMTE